MATDNKTLISLFANGKMPTGGDFEELINSMVNQSQFEKHVENFDDWKTRNDIQIGPKDEGWKLVRENPAHLVLAPNDDTGVAPAQAFVDLYGWTSVYGQIGKVTSRDAFAGATHDIDLATLPNVACDGNWKVLMEMPGRICAFRLTIATTQPIVIEKPGFGRLLQWIIGYVPAANGIVHSVATSTGPNALPHLSNRSGTFASEMIRNAPRLVPFLVAIAILVIGIINRDALDLTTQQGIIEASILGLAAAYFLRCLLQAFTTRRNRLRLRWKRSGGSIFKGDRKWRLEAKGPAFGQSPEARLYYHITALWG